MDGERRTVRAVVRGRVQGVFFRAWTRGQAELLGLDGWVRNRADGAVETVLGGEAAAVETMIDRLWTGPPEAAVADVELEEISDDPPPGFTVRG